MAHHRFIIEDDTFAGSHGRRRSGQVVEDEKGLTAHFLVLERDYIDNTAVCGEEGEQL